MKTNKGILWNRGQRRGHENFSHRGQGHWKFSDPGHGRGHGHDTDNPRARVFTDLCSLIKNFERSLNNLGGGILVLSGIVCVYSCSSKNSFRGTRENNQFFSLLPSFLVYVFCLFQCWNEGCSDFSNVVMSQAVIPQMCMLNICHAINIWPFWGIVEKKIVIYKTQVSY